MSAQKIKKGDHVIVLTGRDKGKHGEVIEVRPRRTARPLVPRRQRRAPPSEADGAAGRRHHLPRKPPSICRTSRSRTPRTASRPASVFKLLDDGRKVRVAKRSGEVIPEKK